MIYIVTHKKVCLPVLEGYVTIQVGAEGKEKFETITDNTGDNISTKNSNYCELTALYWIWKNTSDEYKGLVHYRRFFSRKLSGAFISVSEIEKILANHDMIVPFKRKIKSTVRKQFCQDSGFEKDLVKLGEIIKERCPDYYDEYYNVLDGNNIIFYNMMIAKREVFDGYCKWLFDILFELEKNVDLAEYNDYQKRIFGFLSERLFLLYVRVNKLNLFEVGVINTEENFLPIRRCLIALKRAIKCAII